MKRTEDSNGFESWGGYMGAKKSKLQQQFSAQAEKPGVKLDDLFKNISIFVNGYTEPSANDLRILMMKHGGTYHHYYQTAKTSHIIASNLPDSKIKQFANLKVVKPKWITDSIKAGKVLNFQDYLLLTNQSSTQPSLWYNKCNEINKCSAKVDSLNKDHSDNPQTHCRIKSTTDESFLKDFYSYSRLHYISSMALIFKEYVNKLRGNKHHKLSGLNELLHTKQSRPNISFNEDLIMHIDMDCFFVSVGTRGKTHMMNKPIAVTHVTNSKISSGKVLAPGLEGTYSDLQNHKSVLDGIRSENDLESKSEIASCNYLARKCGIKNGMFVGEALKLCPNLQFIPYDFEAYKEVSSTMYDTVARYTVDIEAVSCDEMYVDCTKLLSLTQLEPMEFASILRKEIKEKTGCPCSIGFGENKLKARLATKKAKPDGQFYLHNDIIDSFLINLPVNELPGIGRMTYCKLQESNIITCGDLQTIPLSKLQEDFGIKQGQFLYSSCRGKTEKGLVFNHVRKSVSADVNYGIRFKSVEERDIFLKNLSDEVAKRLQSANLKGRKITLKLMVRAQDAPKESAKYMGHGICDTITKGTTLSKSVSSGDSIFREVLSIIKTVKVAPEDLRGIGIQITNLESITSEENKLKNFFHLKKSSDTSYKTVDSRLANIPHNNQQELVTYKSQIADAKPSSSKGTSNHQNDNKAEQNCSKQNVDNSQLLNSEFIKETKGEIRSVISPVHLRILVKQWVETEENPQIRDTLLIVDYLQKLIQSHRLEELQLVLRSFKRYIVRNEKSQLWQETYNHIELLVQNWMVHVFNGTLKTEDPS